MGNIDFESVEVFHVNNWLRSKCEQSCNCYTSYCCCTVPDRLLNKLTICDDCVEIVDEIKHSAWKYKDLDNARNVVEEIAWEHVCLVECRFRYIVQHNECLDVSPILKTWRLILREWVDE